MNDAPVIFLKLVSGEEIFAQSHHNPVDVRFINALPDIRISHAMTYDSARGTMIPWMTGPKMEMSISPFDLPIKYIMMQLVAEQIDEYFLETYEEDLFKFGPGQMRDETKTAGRERAML